MSFRNEILTKAAEQLPKIVASKVQCPCCRKKTSELRALQCGHPCCYKCHLEHLARFTRYCGSESYGPKCPFAYSGGKCNARYTREDVRTIISSFNGHVYEEMLEWFNVLFERTNQIFSKCPNALCDGGAWIEPDYSYSDVTCEQCKTVYCKTCKSPPHFQPCCSCRKCLGVHIISAPCVCAACGLGGDCICQFKFKRANLKACPACRTLNTAIADCSHTICQTCSYQYCIHCGDSYSEGHTEEKHGGFFTQSLSHSKDTSSPPHFVIVDRPNVVQSSGQPISPAISIRVSNSIAFNPGFKLQYRFMEVSDITGPLPECQDLQIDNPIQIRISNITLPYVSGITPMRLKITLGGWDVVTETFFVAPPSFRINHSAQTMI